MRGRREPRCFVALVGCRLESTLHDDAHFSLPSLFFSHRSSCLWLALHAMHVLRLDSKAGKCRWEGKVGVLDNLGCTCIALASSSAAGLHGLFAHFIFKFTLL
jgi:hypothetical protein